MQYTTIIGAKVLIIIVIFLIYYFLNDKLDISILNHETFENQIEKDKVNYMKLHETHIESPIASKNEKSLELLYANYDGEEVGKEVWADKTLEQCTDLCNRLDGCKGFSRDAVLDSEPANCYPHNNISNCHSNRKGNFSQMQKAIKFNTYVKSNVPNVQNMCIGDKELTLNRKIMIKSYAMPNKYLGNAGGDNRITLFDKDANGFMTNCSFRIVEGLDGIGTIAFQHIETSKHIYRDTNDILTLKSINMKSTNDRQRVSFNLYDGKSASIMLYPMQLEGETRDKYVLVDGEYLVIKAINMEGKKDSGNKDNEKEKEKAMFYIVDNVVETKIITNKTNIPVEKEKENNKNIKPTMASAATPTTVQSPTISSSTNKTIESFTVVLDKSKDLPEIQNLFNTPSYINMPNYLNDYYGDKNSQFSSQINKRINDITVAKEMGTMINKSEEEYNALNELNGEIEKELTKMNKSLGTNNEKIINRLDRMKLTDIADDYFFLKNYMTSKTKQ
jgi:hypothetical protein